MLYLFIHLSYQLPCRDCLCLSGGLFLLGFQAIEEGFTLPLRMWGLRGQDAGKRHLSTLWGDERIMRLKHDECFMSLKPDQQVN